MRTNLLALLAAGLILAANPAVAVETAPFVTLTVGTAPDGQSALICVYDAGFGAFNIYFPIGSQCPMRWQAPGPGHDTKC
jgi:hypothetical protein